MKLFHLLEELKCAVDIDDCLFLSNNAEKILNEFEKLKELDPKLEILYREFQKEGTFERTI